MREILFRGKRTDNGEWEEGSLVTWPDGYTEICAYESEEAMRKCTVRPETVGQYTGLTDQNGKRIFDGDVVKLTYADGFDETGPIKWSDIDVRYKIAFSDGTAYGVDVTYDFEIIGNIHDNPELLGGDT